ncbi:MAG: hypothetical protein J6C82_00705 [Clostridia bacterium]|nr:hypothetical protein [Clostridia bacterium]
MAIFIGIVLIVAACFYGCYANPYWKEFDEADTYAGGIYRAIVGIPAWVAVISILPKRWDLVFPFLIITAALLVIPFQKLKKDGYDAVKGTVTILFASMGVYSRILMAWTIIGIPVNMRLKRAAEIGWSNAALEVIENLEKNPQTGPSVGEQISDILAQDEERKRKEQEAAQSQEKPEVWRMNGMLVENLKVNSDGTMYYDPDDCEWKKIEQ